MKGISTAHSVVEPTSTAKTVAMTLVEPRIRQAGATVKRYVGSHDGTAQTGDILIDLAAAEVKVPISREDTRLIESAATEALYQIEYRIGGVQRIFMSGKLNLVGSGINDDS